MLIFRFTGQSADLPSIYPKPVENLGGVYERVFKAQQPVEWGVIKWEEELHPRDKDGKFAPKGSGESPLKEHLGMPKPLMKGITSIDQAIELSKKDEKDFVTMLKNVAKLSGGVEIFPPSGPIKSRESVENKIVRKGKKIEEISDFLRGSLGFDNVEGVYKAAKTIIKNLGAAVVEVDDKFAKPTPEGYRDVALKIRTPSGIISEVLDFHQEHDGC